MFEIIFTIFIDQVGFKILLFQTLFGSPSYLCPMVPHSTSMAHWFGRALWFKGYTTATALTMAQIGLIPTASAKVIPTAKCVIVAMATSFPPSTAMTVWSIILDVVTFFFLLRPYCYQVMGLIQEVSIHCFSSVIHYFCPASNRLTHGLIVMDSWIPPIK